MASDAKDSLIGTRIREYEILDVIGKGGMGAVYRANHIYLEEERAVKVIHAPLAEANASFVDRFIREAKILTKLRHPDLVELYEFGRLEENMFFMVMELMKGESVRQRMKKLGRIPIPDALRIIREAANGLNVAHQRGIIHRDISPDNLMLVKTPEGNEITKVIDFGIAKPLYQETHRYTLADMFIGKPEFSSPEQCGAHEEGEQIDARADIYSLAVTLYYIISAKLPFSATTPQGYLVKHASEPPKPVSAHFAPGELPDGIEKLITKALSKKREDRHASMAEFASEIERIQSAMTRSQSGSKLVAGELRPGMTFARRYEIDEKLGRGGMGVVYKAQDKLLEIPVALKTMNPGIADDQRVLNRLKREVVLARKISHPNVCRIYDIGESDGIHYVSMELLEGKPLSDIILTQGAIPVSESLRIVKQILDAVEAAHAVGVLHRDLKPQNIHVDSTGRTHIMDFGISTSSDVSRLTQTGGLVGTPRYMAPEQFSGGKPDLRADIYSIGIILFEMITGALPYEANTPASVMYAHLNQPPKKPSDLISDLPPRLEGVILKALEKLPENRFQTVGEFRSALEPFARPSLEPASVGAQGAITDGIAPTVNIQRLTEPPPPLPPPPPPHAPSRITSGPDPDTLSSAMTKKWVPSRISMLIPAVVLGSLAVVLILWLALRPTERPIVVQQNTLARKPAQQAAPEPQAKEQNTDPAPVPIDPQPEPEATKSEEMTPAPETQQPESVQQETESGKQQEPVATEPPKVEAVPPVSAGNEFSVEVMSTSWKARAEEKASALNQKGYQAYVGEKKDEKGTSYRVRVGRFSDYSKAKDLMGRLKSEMQITGWIATVPKQTVVEPPVQLSRPAEGTEGNISFNGPFPVKIHDGEKLVMDTAIHKSQKLKPGVYTFTMSSKDRAFIDGYKQKVEVKPGESVAIAPPPVGYLSFRAEPPECRITIDETYQVAAPIRDLPVLPGKHRIFVEWRSLEIEEEVTIEIKENQKTQLRGFVTDDAIGVKEE